MGTAEIARSSCVGSTLQKCFPKRSLLLPNFLTSRHPSYPHIPHILPPHPTPKCSRDKLWKKIQYIYHHMYWKASLPSPPEIWSFEDWSEAEETWNQKNPRRLAWRSKRLWRRNWRMIGRREDWRNQKIRWLWRKLQRMMKLSKDGRRLKEARQESKETQVHFAKWWNKESERKKQRSSRSDWRIERRLETQRSNRRIRWCRVSES